jgi:hypothetical protein
MPINISHKQETQKGFQHYLYVSPLQEISSCVNMIGMSFHC